MHSQRQLEGFYSRQPSHNTVSHLSWRHKSIGAISWMRKGNIKTFHSVSLYTCKFFFFFPFLAQNQHCFICFLKTGPTFFFILVIIWSQIQPCSNVCMEFDPSLWFFFLYLALFLQTIRWQDFFFPSMLIILHVWYPFLVLCKLVKIK